MFTVLDNGKVAIIGAFPSTDETIELANKGKVTTVEQLATVVEAEKLRYQAIILLQMYMETADLQSLEVYNLIINRKIDKEEAA